MKKTYTTTVEEDNVTGELYINLSDIADELGWNVGDTLVWQEHTDGTWAITNSSIERKDNRVDLELDLPDDLLWEMFHAAHKQDITLNQLVEKAIQAVIDKENGELPNS